MSVLHDFQHTTQTFDLCVSLCALCIRHSYNTSYVCCIVGKSFGCVDIDIACKNILISAEIGGNIVYQIGQI